MGTVPDEKLLAEMEDIAKKAAFSAGGIIKKHLGRYTHFEEKGRADYVTDTDMACEKTITGIIRERFADHGIVSEEMTEKDYENEFTWIVDPLDGTTNFIHGIPAVAVSIAVMHKKEAVVGVILDPIRDELFSARKGKGAFANGERIRVREFDRMDRAVIGTGFPFKCKHLIDPYLAAFKRIFAKIGDMRRSGSVALDLSHLAAGRLDGFWEIGLSPWDVAAGGILVQEAGGVVSDFWGKDDFVRNGHLVAGTSFTYPMLLEHVRVLLVPSLEAVPKS